MIELPAITRDVIGMNLVADEIKRARQLHEPMKSAHEAYSVILEEIDEFWDEVKKKRRERSSNKMLAELVQVAAMAIRAGSDLGLFQSEEKT